MNYIYVGEIVNTHGIKGEVRLISSFERKDLVFKTGFDVYIGNAKEKLNINTYRVHKQFDMLTFKGLNDINDVIMYKGEKVYILRDNLDNDVHLKTDVIGFNVFYKEKSVGVVSSFFNNGAYDIMVIKNDLKNNFVPYLKQFIQNIDYDKRKINIINMEGLIDEDWYINIIS